VDPPFASKLERRLDASAGLRVAVVGGRATCCPCPSVAVNGFPGSVVEVVDMLEEYSGVVAVDVSLTVGRGTVKSVLESNPPVPPQALINDRALASDVQAIKVPVVLTDGRAKHCRWSEHLSSCHTPP